MPLDRLLARLSGLPAPEKTANKRQALPPALPSYDLSTPLLHFGKRDCWTLHDAFAGTLILGQTGSGKTSGSGYSLLYRLFQVGCGGLILTSKSSDRAMIEEVAALAGREKSLLIVDGSGQMSCNVFEHLTRESGGDAGFIVQTFMDVLKYSGIEGKRAAQDAFWGEQAKMLLKNTLECLMAVGAPLTMQAIQDVFNGIATQMPDGQYRYTAHSPLPAYFAKMEATLPAEEARNIRGYLEGRMAGADFQRTRAGIVATLEGMIGDFLKGTLKTLFCTDTTFTPDISRYGAVIVLDIPTETHGHIGRVGQILFKYLWQKTNLRRQGLPNGHTPMFLWADEFQETMTSLDTSYLERSRSSCIANVFLTQNINGVLARLDPQKGKAQADAMLGNLGTKIFHLNVDNVTNEWASGIIGKDVRIMRSGGQSRSTGVNFGNSTSRNHNASPQGNSGGGGSSASDGVSVNNSDNTGWSERYEYLIPPITFTKLKNGGHAHQGKVEVLFFTAGKCFKRTGQAYLDVSFQQRGMG